MAVYICQQLALSSRCQVLPGVLGKLSVGRYLREERRWMPSPKSGQLHHQHQKPVRCLAACDITLAVMQRNTLVTFVSVFSIGTTLASNNGQKRASLFHNSPEGHRSVHDVFAYFILLTQVSKRLLFKIKLINTCRKPGKILYKNI